MNLKLSLIFSILLFSQISKGNYEVNDTLNVMAMNGLNLRLTNSETSLQVGKVPYGESVIVHDVFKFAYKDEIDSRKGNWIKVDYKGEVGFVFDGYLSKLPAPKLSKGIENPYVRLRDYIKTNFQRTKGPIRIAEPWFDLDGKDGESYEVSTWTNNLKMKETGGYEWFEYKLYFEELRFAELISLFEIIVSADGKYRDSLREALKNYKPSISILEKSKDNSEIKVFNFILTDGIGSKTISYSGGD